METNPLANSIAKIIDRPLRVLVIDDDPVHTLFSETFLGSETTRVLTAATAEDGLELLQNNEFDFVLLDYELPGMTGLQMLETARLRGIRPMPPVMLVTQHRDASVANAAYEAGVCHVFMKPVDWRLLAQMVKYYLTAPEARRLR